MVSKEIFDVGVVGGLGWMGLQVGEDLLGCGADWEVSVFCIYGLLLVVERYSFL
jgi:hypothetical protein